MLQRRLKISLLLFAELLMLWLSTRRSSCDSNYSTFRLPWVHSLHFPSKNFFLFLAVYLRISSFFPWEFFKWTAKVAQLKQQQFISLDSQSISAFSYSWFWRIKLLFFSHLKIIHLFWPVTSFTFFFAAFFKNST